jgi:N-methylhydantoinase A
MDARAAQPAEACAAHATRQALFGTRRDIPVYSFDALLPGHSLTGPAIIEAETTTVLVDTGDRVSVNALGWLDITLRDREAN